MRYLASYCKTWGLVQVIEFEIQDRRKIPPPKAESPPEAVIEFAFENEVDAMCWLYCHISNFAEWYAKTHEERRQAQAFLRMMERAEDRRRLNNTDSQCN